MLKSTAWASPMQTFIRLYVLALAAAVVQPSAMLNAQTAAPAPPTKPWSFAASYAAKETFDGNVHLQDIGDMARKGSMVTSVTPGLSLVYQRSAAFRSTFTYAPEIVRFHSYSSENHATHRAGINFGGVFGATAWEFTNALVRIDGSDQGPIVDVGSACDIPALGGIPLRDRRDAAIWRNGFKLTHSMGRWFLRPVFSSYIHDFRTEQRQRTGAYAGYENYVDRWEASGGVDAGYAVGEKTWVVVGHRYGRQRQGSLLGRESLYSNSYNRVLAGVEGAPASWLRLNILAGPDIRNFEDRPAGFDPHELLWFINGSASFLPSGSDTLTATLSRYQQPAFSSQCVYEDIVYDFSWKRQYGPRLTSTAGVRFYGGDWQAPVNREDWIYTPTASLSYAFHKRLAAEISYSHDWARSRIPHTSGREYTRPLFSVGIRGSL
jgi:hypothetical protein